MREALKEELRSERKRAQDPRLVGDGEIFDHYPVASANRDLYHRLVTRGETFKLSWVNVSDFEDPEFDPERPFAAPSEER